MAMRSHARTTKRPAARSALPIAARPAPGRLARLPRLGEAVREDAEEIAVLRDAEVAAVLARQPVQARLGVAEARPLFTEASAMVIGRGIGELAPSTSAAAGGSIQRGAGSTREQPRSSRGVAPSRLATSSPTVAVRPVYLPRMSTEASLGPLTPLETVVLEDAAARARVVDRPGARRDGHEVRRRRCAGAVPRRAVRSSTSPRTCAAAIPCSSRRPGRRRRLVHARRVVPGA